LAESGRSSELAVAQAAPARRVRDDALSTVRSCTGTLSVSDAACSSMARAVAAASRNGTQLCLIDWLPPVPCGPYF